ncbi:phosphatase 2C-like domain-containing protein [Boletus reticuloceps]|uniref:Phosphatase 2C-like domain-containing protein n=1 Tax=Boletus reticuloceps TaxID=495285 RepID=A0A8I2YHH5_9AGAM|nr:phosphatase 2C-like domain-containing protein [Boletus reticuloceps]
MYGVVALSAATSTENLLALEEVKDFCTTDLGRGGKQRWTYHILEENTIDSELQRLCDPRSSNSVDSVTFQPCSEYATLNQDRHSIEEWDLHGGIWQFNAVYDGHCGHDTVNFVCKRLPAIIRMSLQGLLSGSAGKIPSSELVSEALTNAITHLDDSIRSDLFDFLPCDSLRRLSPDQLREHIRRHESEWETISARCTQGTTVIYSLLDPSKRNLWVVNLGDSQAVLGRKSPSGHWSGCVLNALHNGNNPLERQRIMREHAGEHTCVLDNRVIGYLAPTRAIGDTWLKIPSVYARRAFGAYIPDWISPSLVEQYASRILTPPYVSDVPDVYHFVFDTTVDRQESFLILCSDGFLDIYDNVNVALSESELAERWVHIVGSSLKRRGEQGLPGNLAFDLLRDAIGGDDIDLVSRNLTLEMDDKWIDDVTVLVQRF